MALVLVVAFPLLLGRSPLFPFSLFGALILGRPAVEEPGAASMMVGLFAHQTGPSVFWAKLFGMGVGYAQRPLRLRSCLLAGACVGMVAEALDVYVLLPPVSKQLHGTDFWARYVPHAVGWAAHLAYGLTLGAIYWRWQARAR